MVLGERISTLALDTRAARCDEWIGRHLKRQFVNDHGAERLTFDIHSLPKARCGKQDRIRRHLEFFQQAALAARFALNHTRVGEISGQRLKHRFHLTVTRE